MTPFQSQSYESGKATFALWFMSRAVAVAVLGVRSMTAYSWKTAVSGDWSVAADWNPGGPPNAATADVTIAAAGSYVVSIAAGETFSVNTLLLNGAGSGLDILGTLKLAGTTHKLTLQAGTITLDSGGLVQGGTVALAGGTVAYTGGTLDGVTLRGTLDLSAVGSSVWVADGITLQNAAGTGAGAVNLTGGGALNVTTSTTLDNATISIGGSSSLVNDAAAGTLTLGSHLTVQAVGDGYGTLYGYSDGTIVNTGTINETVAGARLSAYGGAFTNKGVINVGNGGTFYEQATTFNNTGTINVTGGADLNLNGNWTNTGKINVTGSTIDLYGAFATAQLNSITASGSTINVDGDLVNTGTTLNVGTGSALGAVTLGGTITGGVIKDAGGGIVWSGGMLDGVTYRGLLDVGATSSYVYIADGITLQNAAGTGAGAVNLTGGGALYVTTSTTLDNATISIGGSSGLYDWVSGGTLSLGSHLTVQAATDGYCALSGYGDGTIVNSGTINEAVVGGRIYVNSIGNFTNKGVINVGNGGTLYDQATTFGNTGTINVTGGSDLSLGGVWTNTGKINVTGSTIDLYSAFTTAQMNSITASGSRINVAGDLVNTGTTLNVGTGSALGALTLTGTITGGVIKDAGGGIVGAGGTLDSVTYRGTLDLSASSSSVFVANGIVLQNTAGTGAGVINLTGGGGMYAVTTGTLDNAAISIGNSSYLYEFTPGGTLTLGSHLAVQAIGDGYGVLYDGNGDSGVVNLGTITQAISGGYLQVANFATFANKGLINVGNGGTFFEHATTFTNAGTINVTGGGDLLLQGNWESTGKINANGGTIELGGTFTTAQIDTITASSSTIKIEGDLVNTGTTLAIGAGSALGTLTLANAGTITGGVIADAGGGLVANGGTLDGVTYRGTLDLSSSTYLYVADGIVLQNGAGTGPGTVNLTGGGYLGTTTSTTLDNATINLGGDSTLYNYVPAGTLTLGAHLTVRSAGTGYGWIADAYTNGRLVNLGTISAGVAGDNLYIQNFVGFTNSGTLSASNGGGIEIDCPLTNLSGTTLTGGFYSVSGASTLWLSPNVTVATLAAKIVLFGAGSAIQSFNTTSSQYVGLESMLSTVAAGGTLQILGGRGYVTTKTLTDNGSLTLGGGTLQSAGTLTVGTTGVLRGSGTVKSAVAHAGLLEANGGSLTFSGAVSGAGALQADAGSTLTLNQAAIASITGKVTLSGGGSVIRFGAAAPYTTLETSLTGVAAAGSFSVLGGRGFATANAVTVAGLVTLAGGTLTAGALSVAAGGRILGNGTLTNAVANAGTLESYGGILKLSGGVSGAGTLLVDAASTLELAGVSGAGTIVDNGTLKLDGITLTGPVSVAAGSRVVGFGALASATVSAGTIESLGGLLKLAGLTGTSRLQVDAGSTLELTAATAAGTIVDGGVLKLDGVTLTGGVNVSSAGKIVGFGALANQVSDAGTVEASGGLLKLGTFSGAGTLLVDAGSTLELAGTTSVGTLVDSGLLKLDGVTLTAPVSVAAGGRIVGSGSVTGALANAGTVESSVGQLKLGVVTGAGTLLVDATRTMELTAAATAGTVTVNGTLKLDGLTTTATTTSIAAAGLLQGFGTMANAITDLGTIDAKGGLLKLAGAVTGGGALKIETGATLELGAAATQTVTFAAGAVGTLQLDAPASFTGAVGGLALGDAIRFSSETLSSAVINAGTLTVVGSAGTTTYQVAGALTGNHFAISADQHTITLVAGALAPAPARFLASAQADDPAPSWHWPEATLPPLPFGPPWPDLPSGWAGGPPGVSAAAGLEWSMAHADHAPSLHHA